MHIQSSRYYRVAALTMLSLLVMFSTSRAQGNFTDIGTTAAIPVVLDGHGVDRLQATLTYDPSLMSVGTPVLANEAEELMLGSRIEDGSLRHGGTVQQSSPATYANLIVDAWVPE